MSILERVNSSNDIKKLNNQELTQYCKEVREFLVENLSQTGGHLASNLGTVEIAVALHRVYDTSKDRLVLMSDIRATFIRSLQAGVQSFLHCANMAVFPVFQSLMKAMMMHL